MHYMGLHAVKGLPIEDLGLRAVEGHAHLHEHIGKALHANANGPVPHVGALGVLDRVVVDVNDLVQVPGDNLGHLVKAL